MSAELISEFDERVLAALALENEQQPLDRLGAIIWRDACGTLELMGWNLCLVTLWGKQFSTLRRTSSEEDAP